MRRKIIYILPILLALSSCHVQEYLKDDEYMLKSNHMTVSMIDSTETPREIRSALSGANTYYRQKGNRNLLGVRYLLGVYGIFQPNDHSGLANFVRRQGEPPVVYDENASITTAKQLETLIKSKGCFNSTVSFDTIHKRHRDILVIYRVIASQRYKISNVRFQSQNDNVTDLLNKWADDSYLHTGDYYDQSLMDKERDRIASNLRNEGYFLVTKNLIHYLVDTNEGDYKLAITVDVRNPKVTDSNYVAKEVPLQVYTIDNIYLYPNSTTAVVEGGYDTTIYTYTNGRSRTDYVFLHQGEMSLSPKALSQAMLLYHEQPYRTRHVNSTYNSLIGLHNFKYIDIDFQESPNSCDSARKLDAHVRLLNSSRRKISASIELSNASNSYRYTPDGYNYLTSGNLGIEGILNYQDKNLWGRAELLNIDGNLLFEIPKTVWSNGPSGFYGTFSSFESGIEATLDLPQLLLPFTRNISWQRVRPHTQISFNANYQYLSYLERLQFGGSFGYNWSHSRRVQNKLLPFNLSYSHIINADADYVRRFFTNTNDIRQMYLLVDYFILNSNYEYTFSNQRVNTRDDFDYLRLSAETAGNLLSAICKLGKVPLSNAGTYDIFGVTFAQYARLEGEYKHYFYHGNNNTFVTRFTGGIGVPYGNSDMLPYEKSFFGGGPTTMRAWQVRRLGPGSYSTSQLGNNMALSMGDMMLVLNLEERFPIAGILHGTVFADIGNIWNIRNLGTLDGSLFEGSRFWKELAVGLGVGLRLNISVITLRLDFALPFYDPGYEENHRLIFDHFKWNKFVTNFGIGLPF